MHTESLHTHLASLMLLIATRLISPLQGMAFICDENRRLNVHACCLSVFFTKG